LLGLAAPEDLLLDVPPDGLALAVRVGRDEDLVGAPGGRGERLDDLFLAGDDLLGRLEVVVEVDANALLGKVLDVAHRGEHLVLRAEIFINGLRLRGRLYDNE